MDLTLALTHRCNLACTYCYAGPSMRRSMPWEVADRAISLALSYRPAELRLGFFGGEPLLEWDLLVRATETAEQKAAAAGVRLVPLITTNATLLTRERLGWMVDHGVHLAVSIDGGRAMHEATRPLNGGGSSYDRCLAGLELALGSMPELQTISVVDPRNVSHLGAGVRFLVEEMGVTDVSVSPNFTGRWTPEALALWRTGYLELGTLCVDRFRAGRPVRIDVIDSKIITRLKDGYECSDRCSFGLQEVAVAPSGRIYPCERLIGDDSDDTLCLGNVLSGLDDSRRHALAARRGNSDVDCTGCAIQSRCMNWCGCVNYATTGAIDRAHGLLCFQERLAVEVADRVARTLFAEGCPAFFEWYYQDDLRLT